MLKYLSGALKAQSESEPVSFWGRLSQGLKRSKAQWHEQFLNLIYGKKQIDQAFLQVLEACLLRSDMGVQTTSTVIRDLTDQVERNSLKDSQSLLSLLHGILVNRLKPYEGVMVWQGLTKPQVILMVGVNGAGKTTTIGKLACYFQKQHKKVILAAGDTFRVAAIEQLSHWGKNHGIPVVSQPIGSDSASVIFDTFQSAQARQSDLVLADTAGRLHTQHHLMDELKKIKRVLGKLDAEAPHHVWLVLDATVGQNAIQQVEWFNQTLGLTGLCMSKLDGTAKGGLLFALTERFHLPIYFVGLGEQAGDLQAFQAQPFVEALLADE